MTSNTHATHHQHRTITDRTALPPQAYHPSSHHHEPLSETDDGPNTVNAVQHVLRAAVADQQRLSAATGVVSSFGPFEAAELLPDFEDLKAALETADQYMADQLRPHIGEMEAKVEQRKEWYDSLIDGEWGPSMTDVVQRAQNIYNANSEFAHVTVSRSTNIDIPPFVDTILSPSDLARSPEAFGYELPHTFLAVNNAQKPDSIYPFVPWFGTVVCLCHAKQEQAFMPCCKHELFAAYTHGKHPGTTPNQLPDPYTRIVAPAGRRLLDRYRTWSDQQL